ncbi:Transposon Tf2-8 polyprotein [Abeliophyllum distichum]|uniref:Transposon Tf2-8 polyprotein n=1 Tax=Abeliophyllum distichum TaxID=126358 RepID=A0ABD1SUU0_9LAMI
MGHRCKNKELQVLLIQEGEEWELDEKEEGVGAAAKETDVVGESWYKHLVYCGPRLRAMELTVQGVGICKGVSLEIQSVHIKEDFLPLELGSSDVILGMKWLAILGGTQVNRKELTMKFQVGRTSVTLQGDPSLSKTLVSMKSMIKAFRENGEGVLLELGNITSDFVESS